jgi:hypothetical protein
MGHSIMETEVGRLPYFIDPGISTAAYGYVALVTLVAAIIAGVVPALQATGRRMEITLKEFGSRGGLRLGGTWTTLIVLQVALAVAGLPIAMASFGVNIISLSTTPTFETRPYLAAMISADSEPPPGVDRETYRRDAAMRSAKLRSDLVERIESESLVADVTLAQSVPGDEPAAQLEVEGEALPLTGAMSVRYNEVSSDFFAAFGLPPVSGRLLVPSDAASATRPVVVNQSFVSRVLGNRDPIGTRFRYLKSRRDVVPGDSPERTDDDVERGEWNEIVGVVGDFFTNPLDPELVRPGVFHALGTVADSGPALIVKVRGPEAADFATRLREIAIALDPSVRLSVRPFVELERQEMLARRLMMLALSLVVITVLLLSAAGIYALMSFTVSRRRKEIGIRAAMGADSAQLLRGIFARSAGQLGIGVALGAGIALAADFLSGGEVLGAWGRGLFVPAIAILMIGVGLVASIGPARRGLKVQPTEALRAE